ncbi:histidine phosphatase family protein [Lacticaseibacillus songhuajiangensis]|jgi:probable phosphoglycerate mutase|uniref:histidine phosphatase family protein n=1 Tax=Lacticaseibacillus songhuajiangensis TaxID=1296539 RepID=UPI000F7812F2|nr:histidine phosphatase family protein [Lacticaseibacillus songhuajiangensis]
MADLYLVRHGETVINAQERFNGGGVDSPLTAKGVAGARQVHDLLAPVRFDRIISSPMPRAMTTTELIVGADKPVTIDPRLREMSLGDWDGQLLADWAGNDEFIKYRHHMEQWDYARFHAEGYQHMVQRASAAFDDAATVLGEHGRGLVVSHGIVLTIMANILNGTPLDHARDSGQLANTSVTVLHKRAGQWSILVWNVTPANLAALTPTQHALLD